MEDLEVHMNFIKLLHLDSWALTHSLSPPAQQLREEYFRISYRQQYNPLNALLWIHLFGYNQTLIQLGLEPLLGNLQLPLFVAYIQNYRTQCTIQDQLVLCRDQSRANDMEHQDSQQHTSGTFDTLPT